MDSLTDLTLAWWGYLGWPSLQHEFPQADGDSERGALLSGGSSGWRAGGVAHLEEVERVDGLERAVVVAHQGVHALQADQREVAQHAQHVGLLRGVALRLREPFRRA